MRRRGFLLLLFSLLSLPQIVAAAADSVCIQCHSGLEGRLSEPLKEWPDSVHAASGITCHSCHGGDPTDFALAMSPERGFLGVPAAEKIPEFCGRCHPGVLADYRDSAHGAALGAGGPQCVTCHGNHAVRRATLELINPRDCSRCHSYDRAEPIRDAMAATDGAIVDLQTKLAELRRLGFVTKEQEGELFAARNSFHRLFHTIDLGKVRLQTAAIEAELDKVRKVVEGRRAEISRRRLWGGGVIALLLFVGGMALLLHRDYLGGRRAGAGAEETMKEGRVSANSSESL